MVGRWTDPGGPSTEGRASEACQQQARVRAAEAEGVGQPWARPEGSWRALDDIHRDSRVEVAKTGHRRDQPVAQGPEVDDDLHRAGTPDHVAGRALHRRNRGPRPVEQGGQRLRLGQVVSLRAGAVGVHVAHIPGLRRRRPAPAACTAVRPPHQGSVRPSGARRCRRRTRSRRRAPPAARRRPGGHHVHLAPRHAAAGTEDAAGRGAVRAAGQEPRRQAASSRPRHRRVPHQRSRFRADGAASQSQAQQGAARAQCDLDHRQRGHPPCRGGRPRASGADQRPLHAADPAVRLHGTAERAGALAVARKQGWQFDIMSTSFFLSRRSVRPDPRSGMPPWQDRLYIFLAHNADDASSYFQLPTDRVVEIGTQVTV